jgi:hypothetical protein
VIRFSIYLRMLYLFLLFCCSLVALALSKEKPLATDKAGTARWLASKYNTTLNWGVSRDFAALANSLQCIQLTSVRFHFCLSFIPPCSL